MFLNVLPCCRRLTVPALSYRPMEKVLSGVLTLSTAPTWSKPLRSSTSPPHMPSAHHPPPHPGKLSSVTLCHIEHEYLFFALMWQKIAFQNQNCHTSITNIHLFTELGLLAFYLDFYFRGLHFYFICSIYKFWRVTFNFLVLPERSRLLFTSYSASSPPRHLFLQGCSFKGETEANMPHCLSLDMYNKAACPARICRCIQIPICAVFLSVCLCSILILLPLHISVPEHSASLCVYPQLFTLICCFQVIDAIDHNVESSQSQPPLPTRLLDL